MANASALRDDSRIAPTPRPQAPRERRAPAPVMDLESFEGMNPVEDTGRAARREGAGLHWPGSWPAALYRGDSGAACRVRAFSTAGAQIVMADPPPDGARVALKFPFTVYLGGRVAWRRGGELGIEFDEPARRSARLVEDVLFDKSGI